MKKYSEGYVTGVLIGDGYFYEKENRIQLQVKDEYFAEKFREELSNYTEKDVKYSKYDYYEVRCWLGNDKILDIENKVLEEKITQFNTNFIKGVLEGLFDSEGSIIIHNNIPRISYGSTSKKEAELYISCLEHFDISYNKQYSGKVYEVNIGKRNQCKKFMSKITPSIKRKIKTYKNWKDSYTPSHNKWSQKEVEILKNNYAEKGSDIKELRNNNRTGDDIRTKANNIGLSKR